MNEIDHLKLKSSATYGLTILGMIADIGILYAFSSALDGPWGFGY